MRAFLPQVELWTHDRARFPLPPRHRFPLAKYSLLRRRVVELGLATPEEIHETEPVAWALLERVHDGALLRAHPRRRAERARAARARPAVVARAGRARPPLGRGHAWRRPATRSAHGVAMNLGGGTHHAGRAFARGYCLFNDVVCTLARAARERPRASARSSSTATSTRATAPPTCSARDPHAFTLSLHGARNYPFQRIPSDLDVDLADRHRRRGLPRGARPRARRGAGRARAPEIAFYLAGADPWEGDRLGPPRAHQAGPARPRRARARPPARGRRGRLRRARRRLRGGRARHRRHQRRDRGGGRRRGRELSLDPAPGA